MDQFLLFGDSITQHSFSQERGYAFGAALSDTYVRRLDVVNRGYSGYNTKQALQVLPLALPSPTCAKLRFITIWLGANDARLPDTPGGPQQHIPLPEYTENIKTIATHPKVVAHQGVRRILITPPAVDERKCLENDKRKDPNMPNVIRRRASVTAKYARAVCEVGRELDIEVLDIWSAMITRAGGSVADSEPLGSIDMPCSEVLQSFVHDGLHLSPVGYKLLYDELLTLIQKRWPDQSPERLPFILPAWDNGDAWTEQFSL